jgi:hypothetical protein
MRILGPHCNEVRREIDLAIFQVHRFVQVHNPQIVQIRDGKRKVNAPGDALISSRVAEPLAAQEVRAGSNFDANDTCIQWYDGYNQKEK